MKKYFKFTYIKNMGVTECFDTVHFIMCGLLTKGDFKDIIIDSFKKLCVFWTDTSIIKLKLIGTCFKIYFLVQTSQSSTYN